MLVKHRRWLRWARKAPNKTQTHDLTHDSPQHATIKTGRAGRPANKQYKSAGKETHKYNIPRSLLNNHCKWLRWARKSPNKTQTHDPTNVEPQHATIRAGRAGRPANQQKNANTGNKAHKTYVCRELCSSNIASQMATLGAHGAQQNPNTRPYKR